MVPKLLYNRRSADDEVLQGSSNEELLSVKIWNFLFPRVVMEGARGNKTSRSEACELGHSLNYQIRQVVFKFGSANGFVQLGL